MHTVDGDKCIGSGNHSSMSAHDAITIDNMPAHRGRTPGNKLRKHLPSAASASLSD
jgi:hypothetical protein